jgi:hypothetical protein
VARGMFDALSLWWDDTKQHKTKTLAEWVWSRHKNGASLRLIARELTDLTGGRHSVSHTSITRWVKALESGDRPS